MGEFIAKEIILKVYGLGKQGEGGGADDMFQLVLDVAKYIAPNTLESKVDVEMEGGRLQCLLRLDVIGGVRRHINTIVDKSMEYYIGEVNVPEIRMGNFREEVTRGVDEADENCH